MVSLTPVIQYPPLWHWDHDAEIVIGSAFNQLAVISTYVGDDLLCVYYYIRALAVRQAFKNIDEILEKFLRKVYERWHAAREEGTLRKEVEGDDSEGLLEEFKRGYLVVISILFRRAG